PMPLFFSTAMLGWSGGRRLRGNVGRIEIVLTCNPHEREQRVAPRIGKRHAHALWTCYIGDRAYRPFGRNPFARGMRKGCGQLHEPGGLVYRGCLDNRDFLLAERLADDVESARKRSITK